MIFTGSLIKKAEINSRPDRDEKHREQQALERVKILLQLMPVFAFRQNHARQKCAERRRKADQLHQQRDADNDQQREGDENLADFRARHNAEQRPHQVAPGQDDRRHRAQHRQRLRPGGKARDQAVVFRPACALHGQKRQQGEHRDDGNILKQQHGKCRLPDRCLHQSALLHALQHDSGGRQRQHQPDGQRRFPFKAKRQRRAADRRRGPRHLQAAKPKNGPPQIPEL